MKEPTFKCCICDLVKKVMGLRLGTATTGLWRSKVRQTSQLLCSVKSILVVKHIKKYISISSYYAPSLQQIKNCADDHDGVLEESCSLFSSIHFRIFMAASTRCASDSTPLTRVKLLNGFIQVNKLVIIFVGWFGNKLYFLMRVGVV
ncbi:hypothetical protein K7X08_003759 [Anisodus acutangulus]|uniref:Uncharacterized protein n=1 Tax=Anisodus acutangulus TaxID=402998 RepID=A0A9Q1MJ55_9SOLA|nr:hypothetical protein K7X08_003759 [Anisodus acutangulus]